MDGSTGAIRSGSASRRDGPTNSGTGGSANRREAQMSGAAATERASQQDSKSSRAGARSGAAEANWQGTPHESGSARTPEAGQKRLGASSTANSTNSSGNGSNTSAHATPPVRTGAGNQHERAAKDTYGARVSWRDADPAACCSTVEQIKWAQGVRMGSATQQSGWKVSEVERLIGLPRRDIQRACYEGAGGAGILSPADSSWGRRLYSKDDLLTLFMVKQERDQGLSLPEIKRLFEEKEGEPGGWGRFVDDQVARMRDEFEDAAWRLASAEALRAATRDGEDDEAEKGTNADEADKAEAAEGAGEAGSNNSAALNEVIDRILLLGVLEIMDDGGRTADEAAALDMEASRATSIPVDASAEGSADTCTTATASEAEGGSADPAATSGDGAEPASSGDAADGSVQSGLQKARQVLYELWQDLADCRAQGFAPNASEAQAAVARALDGCAGLTGASEPTGTASTATGQPATAAQPAAAKLVRLLDAPGMELALELRHGPGAYAYIRDAAEAFAAASEDNATSTNKYQQA